MTENAFPGRGKVAIVRTTPETVLDDYARLLELVDYAAVLPKANKTLLKINIFVANVVSRLFHDPLAVGGGHQSAAGRRL